jgi:hypothetical protein
MITNVRLNTDLFYIDGTMQQLSKIRQKNISTHWKKTEYKYDRIFWEKIS